MNTATAPTRPAPARPRSRWTHHVPDEFYDRPDLTPERSWLGVCFDRLARERPYCLTSNEELMDRTGWSRNTLAKHLREYEAAGWGRRVLIPGRHGRATGRIGIVLFVRPAGLDVATEATYDQVVAAMEAEIRGARGRTRTLAFPPVAPQGLGTAVPKVWGPSVPKVWGPPCIKEDTGESTETTTTAGPGSGAPADIHACEASSSSPVSIPLRPEGEAIPQPEASDVARPIEAVDQALLTTLAARAVVLFGLAADRARGKVAAAISAGRRLAREWGFRFEPAWIGAAMDEAERRKAAGTLRGWHWGVVLGIAGNYAREGGPSAREDLRPGAPRPFDPAVWLARLEGHGWTLARHGPDQVKPAEIRGRGSPLWAKLPGDLLEQFAAHKAEIKAHVLGRPAP